MKNWLRGVVEGIFESRGRGGKESQSIVHVDKQMTEKEIFMNYYALSNKQRAVLNHHSSDFPMFNEQVKSSQLNLWCASCLFEWLFWNYCLLAYSYHGQSLRPTHGPSQAVRDRNTHGVGARVVGFPIQIPKTGRKLAQRLSALESHPLKELVCPEV